MDTRTALSRALERRKRELTLEWHGQLQQRLDLRPQHVFPTTELLDHVPEVIAWIAERLDNGASAQDLADRLRPLVRLRRRQGHFMEELLVEFGMLGRILADALIAEIEAHHGEMSAGRAARLSSDLSAAGTEVLTVLGALYREEELAAERAARRRLNEYSRVLSHELNNPLSSADLAVQALTTLDGVDDERFEDMARRVQSAVRSAARVVEAVRALSLAEDPDAGDDAEEPLRTVVERAVARAESMASPAGVAVELDGPVPEGIRVNGRRLEMVLHNLLVNGVKYADREKPTSWVRISVPSETDPPGVGGVEGVEGVTPSADGVTIRVSDNGIGIVEEDVERVFDRFYRARPGQVEGNGLGLSIAREAMEQLGGEIRCESEPGAGTTFEVVVPVRRKVVAG